MKAAFERLGFDGARLNFSLRTALAAFVAVLIAWALGLEHPQWAGMATWAASQPLRGALLARGWARAAGTIIGSVFGVVLMVISGGHLWILIVGIALWHGACAMTGNLLRGFTSYIAMLSGYSAAMVALLDSSHPGNIYALGLDRCLTGFTGVVVALALHWLFARPSRPELAETQAEALTAKLLRAVAEAFEGAPLDPGIGAASLTEMARIEAQIDLQAAGSAAGRAKGVRTRALLTAGVGLVLWLRAHGGAVTADAGRAAELRRLAGTLETGADPSATARDIAALTRAATDSPTLAEALEEVAAALDPSAVAGAEAEAPELALHRDWAGGWQAALRASLALLAVGAVWLISGWSMGAYMMLGTAIMTSIFSTFENPLKTLRVVLIGQILGGLGALACRWLAWPMADSSFEMVLWLAPFIAIGGLVAAHRRTAMMSYDYNMVLLLLLQPVFPEPMTFPVSVLAVCAAVAGPAVGLAAFRLVYPVTRRRRQQALVKAMVDDIEKLAARPGAPRHRRAWRQRLYHRLLLAVFRDAGAGAAAGERTAPGTTAGSGLVEMWLTFLHLGRAIQQLRVAAAETAEPAAFRNALGELQHLGDEPDGAATALERAAELPGVDPLPLRMAAGQLRSQLPRLKEGMTA